MDHYYFVILWAEIYHKMSTVRLHIVALPYYEVGGCLGEFLAEAQGRAMTLRPDPTNDVDVNAICAYDWQGRHVGYVAIHDQLAAWQTLRGSGRRSLRGRVCEVNAEHKCVVFECCMETMGDVEDLYPQTAYLKWTYTGPVLKASQETVTLDYMMDEISERLDERDGWDEADRENFVVLCKRFSALSKYDLSGEMSDYRRRLCLRLLETRDEALLPLVEELNMAYGRAGRESQGGEVLDYWMCLLTAPRNIKSLLVHRHEYDLEKVHEQLLAFPEAMYEEWLENRERFVTKLLYMHIPREVLWRFISGIAFYEAMTARNKAISEEKKQTETCDEESPVQLSTAKGQKIDMIRTLNVMYEQGRFKGKDGKKLTKKDFFRTMGKAMNVDLSDYDKDLSRSMSDSTKLEKHLKPFDEMKEKMIEIWNSK